MNKIETKIYVKTEDGMSVYEHCKLSIGALIGLHGEPAVKMFLETEIRNRTDKELVEKGEVREPHVEIKFVCMKENLIEDVVKMLLGMLDLLVDKEQIKMTHTYLNPDKSE